MLQRRTRPQDLYAELRHRVLALRPSMVGLAPNDRHPRVFGAMFETGFDEGSMSLLCLADGTTSLYLSNGGGVIGAGQHQQVAEAAWAFLDVLEAGLDAFVPDLDQARPEPGEVVVRVLTFDGRVRRDGAEASLADDAMFLAAHDVVMQIRRCASAS